MSNLVLFPEIGSAFPQEMIGEVSVEVTPSVQYEVNASEDPENPVVVTETSFYTLNFNAEIKGKKKPVLLYSCVSGISTVEKSLDDSSFMTNLVEAKEKTVISTLGELSERIASSLKLKERAASNPEVFSFNEKNKKNFEIRVNKLHSLVEDYLEGSGETISFTDALESDDFDSESLKSNLALGFEHVQALYTGITSDRLYMDDSSPVKGSLKEEADEDWEGQETTLDLDSDDTEEFDKDVEASLEEEPNQEVIEPAMPSMKEAV